MSDRLKKVFTTPRYTLEEASEILSVPSEPNLVAVGRQLASLVNAAVEHNPEAQAFMAVYRRGLLKPALPQPHAKRGRPKGTYDLPDEDLYQQMANARAHWFATHAKRNHITQEQLLEAMGEPPEVETRRVREWCRRLTLNWDHFRRRQPSDRPS